MAQSVLLFIPLDGRPVTLDQMRDLAQAAGAEVRVPDRALLGDRFRPGDVAGVWGWLEQAAAGADALIASVEMLCFGGLVAARKSEVGFDAVAPQLQRLIALASRVPTYVSAVIPRTPVQPTDEDAPYWAAYGEALRRIVTVPQGSPLAAIEAALQSAHLPEPVHAAVRAHRERHLRLHTSLIEAAARGTLRYVLIGQDDTSPGSLSELERAGLQAEARSRGTANVLLTTGADELNVRLLARWLNHLTGDSPAVRVVYTFPWASDLIPRYEAVPLSQTVAEHVESAGCRLTEDEPEIILWVHNFEAAQQEAAHQDGGLDGHAVAPILSAVRAAALEERVVALADVRFANGADRALLTRLLAEPRVAGIVAYAGWNTCSNSLGSCLGQAVVAHHLRAGTLPGSDRLYRPAFFARFIDDWGYQALVRRRLEDWLQERGATPADLSAHEAASEAAALEWLRREAVPALQAAFPHQPITLHRVTFPWHRLFEVRVELEVATSGKTGPEGNIVVDYDPRWPQMYEDDKAAILRVVGPLVLGIEHIGSTSVPGLAAKPIIDIMLGVEVDALDRTIQPLRRTGYEYNPDWEISMPMRRYFRRCTADGTNTHHLHVVPHGGALWTRHLRFRDYLRAHPERARAYGELKKSLARQRQGGIDYTFAKSEFIRSVETLAGIAPRRPAAPAP